jgi:predicted peptidase
MSGNVRQDHFAPFAYNSRQLRKRGDPEQAAQKLKDEPIWVFHGGADPTAPVEQSHRMVDALKAAGSSVKYTEYPGVGHNSWDRAYSEKDLTDWLFALTREKATPAKTAQVR